MKNYTVRTYLFNELETHAQENALWKLRRNQLEVFFDDFMADDVSYKFKLPDSVLSYEWMIKDDKETIKLFCTTEDEALNKKVVSFMNEKMHEYTNKEQLLSLIEDEENPYIYFYTGDSIDPCELKE